MLKICADIYPKIQFEISIKTNSHGATFPTPTLVLTELTLVTWTFFRPYIGTDKRVRYLTGEFNLLNTGEMEFLKSG